MNPPEASFAEHIDHLPARQRNVRVLLAVLVALCLIFLATYLQRQGERDAVRAEIVQARQLLADQQQRQAELQAELARVDDPAYVAAQARDELGLIQQGDRPIVVLEAPATPAPAAAPTPTPAGAEPAHSPVWQQWLQLLGPGSRDVPTSRP